MPRKRTPKTTATAAPKLTVGQRVQLPAGYRGPSTHGYVTRISPATVIVKTKGGGLVMGPHASFTPAAPQPETAVSTPAANDTPDPEEV